MVDRVPRLAVLLLAVLGCGGGSSPAPAGTEGSGSTSGGGSPSTGAPAGDDTAASTGDTTGGDEVPPAALPCDDPEGVEARIDVALQALTLEEKVALLHGASLMVVDGTWLVEGNAAQGIPGLHMLDGPRGVSKVAGVDATAFPVGIMRGATWDPELERQVGVAMAREARATGADVLLAPTINVLRHPGWGRAQETYGEDTVHIGTMGVAFIEGVQSEQVVATAKHFAVNSIEDTRFVVDVTVDERTLREIYLPHFRRAVDAGVGAVMSAYNSVNGAYCDQNAHLLGDILKDEWGFSGLVMSDWILGTHSSVESLRAGLDIEMPTGAYFSGLVDAVEAGILQEEEVDAAVRRVVRVQWCFGLDASPPVLDPSARETPEHLALAREVAGRGMVLLQNDGALPLAADALGEIVVLGPLADLENIGDDGSSAVQPSDVVTALEGITARATGVTVTHLDVSSLGPADEAAIAGADAVIVVAGLTGEDEGEGLIAAGDRDSLLLPPDQVALIQAVAAVGTPTVVVLEGGGAIVVSAWVDAVSALVLAFYPGSEGGHAIADVLFGDVAPSGRLPFSIPYDEADLPPFDHVSEAVTYGNLHGYRHLDAQRTPAQFAFGFGLGTTTFELGALDVQPAQPATLRPGDTLDVTVEVTNAGDRAGIQTVQVYVGRPGSPTATAPRDLRAFTQVTLDPGETQAVSLQVLVAELRVWNETDGWHLESGDLLVEVGTSAADLPLSATVSVTGDG